MTLKLMDPQTYEAIGLKLPFMLLIDLISMRLDWNYGFIHSLILHATNAVEHLPTHYVQTVS